MVDEVADPPPGVFQVEEHRGFQAFPPQRAPETLDLAERLRMPRPRHHLANAPLPNSLVNALLPRQVMYWLPLSVRISAGVPYDVIAARNTSSTKAADWLACRP